MSAVRGRWKMSFFGVLVVWMVARSVIAANTDIQSDAKPVQVQSLIQ